MKMTSFQHIQKNFAQFISLILIGLSFSSSGFSLEVSEFMKPGFIEMKSELWETFKNELSQSNECPRGGEVVYPDLAQKKSPALMAANTVQGVIAQTDAQMKSLLTENNRCGVCTQQNIISQFAVIHPDFTIDNSFCENRPTKTIQKILNTTQEVKTYTQAVLQGSNEEGAAMAKDCPNPCAYYVTTAQTPTADLKTHLTMTVQCGMPRRDPIFTAQYSYKAGLLQNWSCLKK